MGIKTIPASTSVGESTGVVIQVDVSGVGLIEADSTHRKYPFTFDTVKGYYGQPLAAAGLTRGSKVKFDETDGIVKFVEII
ncbi:MAG: hypothetical protein FJX37_09610 [Alphaproteobacteria bacterium]|jgi:hypothetical protein|nr:hypothetical protein [Alphaproteobacteria bacterium]MBM3952208.1 hypothetical protein [Rhodospirillales bacterium]